MTGRRLSDLAKETIAESLRDLDAGQMPKMTEAVLKGAFGERYRRPTSLWQDALRRLLRNKLAIVGMTVLVAFFLSALLAPWVAPYDPIKQELLKRRQSPSWEHPMGIDEVGRDILSRIIFGTRTSLQVGVGSVSFAIAVGALVGALSGYLGGWVDNLVMRLMDIVLAFPSMLLAIAIVSILEPGLMNMLYAIAIVSIPQYARIVRASVLSVKEQDYVLAARAIGCRPSHILFRNILPNCLTPLIVQATLGIATAILDAAGLSFLGLGAQPPTPEWGAMLGRGRGSVFTAPHIVFFPGLAIVLTVLGFNLLGDGLRDGLDVRLRID